MNLPFFIARKYFWSKKKRSFINIISIISVICIAGGTMVMVIVMSLFNGLDGLIRSLFQSFDAPLEISHSRQPYFLLSDSQRQEILNIDGVRGISEVLEEQAYVQYKDNDAVVTIKGMEASSANTQDWIRHLVSGSADLYRDSIPYTIIGQGVQYTLGIPNNDAFYAIRAFYPLSVSPMSIVPRFSQQVIIPGGVFAVEKQFDEEYMFVPIGWARKLFNIPEKYTSLDILLTTGADIEKIQQSIQQHLGSDFNVLNSDQQHGTLFKIVKIEKFFSFLGLSVILLIASINIFFSLSMLVIDKKKDIAILQALGITRSSLKKIIIFEGAIMSVGGAFIGLLLGLIFCWLQDRFGILTMGTSSAVMNVYPIQVATGDLVLILSSVIFITLIITLYPASVAARDQFNTTK